MFRSFFLMSRFSNPKSHKLGSQQTISVIPNRKNVFPQNTKKNANPPNKISVKFSRYVKHFQK